MDKRTVRKMALLLLDDENGIGLEAYGFLSVMLRETENEDILDAVDVTENRAYVGEDYAEEEILKMEVPNISEARIEDPIEKGNCRSVLNTDTMELELQVDEDEEAPKND
jgi:hypothetical protein